MKNVKTINYFTNYECDEWLLVNKNIILMVNPNKNQLKFVISTIYKIFYIYIERERESITLIDIKKDRRGEIKFLEGNFKCSTSKSMILIRVLS